MGTFYITTPIYYVNREPHLGSIYTTIVADCLRRYKRQRGHESFFLTGTDEHGINIERIAERSGRTPKEHADHIAHLFQKIFADFHLDTAHGGYDIFMRTTEPFHYEGVQHFWREIARSRTPHGREAIYKGFYEGWFCASCAAYKTEDEYIRAEREGDPPLCRDHLVPLDRISEESYFFRLSDFGEALIELYERRPDLIRPEERRNEVLSFVRSGLQDVSISRLKTSVSWGIPVPDDPGHTVYLWLDALTNYITAIGYGRTRAGQAPGFEKFWPAVHLVGKDILRFHAVLWPAFLLAAGLEVPRMIFAHGMWQDRTGRRMSKTLGNTIDLGILRRNFRVDMLRYFCLREMVFGQDAKFSYEAVIDRANSDLASGLGNLSSRTLTMIQRYFDGAVPPADIDVERRLLAKRAGVDSDAVELASSLEHARNQFLAQMDDFAPSRALEIAWSVIARVDKFISDAKPWELAKTEEHRQTLGAVLYRSAEVLRWLTVMLYPFMPEAMSDVWRQLGREEDLHSIDPARLAWGGMQAGKGVGEVTPIFPRIDKAKTMDQIKRETDGVESEGSHATQAAVPGSPAAGETQPEPPQKRATEADAVPGGAGAPSAGGPQLIGIEDFTKVEMRVGEILTAERVPKADKLLRFTIDLGEPTPRQVLAGIAMYYEPEKLIGRKVAVVSNLQPRKLRGFESQGMVLAASVGEDGRPVLATFTEDVPNGARLK